MMSSMTGFAALELETASGVLLIELRSVNHRYLELQLKLDENLRSFEPLLRELISGRLGRGKVECRLSLMTPAGSSRPAQLDTTVLQQLAGLSTAIRQQFPDSRPLAVADILRWPGVMMSKDILHPGLADDIRGLLLQALDDMAAARSREGAKLRILILDRLDEMQRLISVIKPLLPLQIKAYQQRLTSKLQETLKGVDEERVRQEVVLFAQRLDVDEELTRLVAHMQEVRRILDAEGPSGKQLDFLMQELNREANTLGSKSVSTEVSQTAMTLKVLIEQMREQIQNLE